MYVYEQNFTEGHLKKKKKKTYGKVDSVHKQDSI